MARLEPDDYLYVHRLQSQLFFEPVYMVGIVGFILVGFGCFALTTEIVGRYIASVTIGSGYMLLISGVALMFENRDENVDYLIMSDIYCKAMFIAKSNLQNESGLTGNANPMSSYTHHFSTLPRSGKTNTRQSHALYPHCSGTAANYSWEVAHFATEYIYVMTLNLLYVM